MVNAQEWLDKEYPKEGWIEKYEWRNKDKKITRSEVRNIYLTELGLEGELDLKDFTYNYYNGKKCGVKVFISTEVDEVKITFKNLPKYAEIIRNSWIDIHKGFSDKWAAKTHQQYWEQADFTKQEAKEWIELGFEPNDLYKVKQWKNLNFSLTETKAWLEVGLEKDDWEFASWLRTNNHIPELVKNNLEKLWNDYRCGLCDKCKKLNTSEKWCQPCAEKEWKQLIGQELINKFIEQQGKDREGKDKLPWIPYEEFTDIKHLADGGFSKIYKAKWERKEETESESLDDEDSEYDSYYEDSESDEEDVVLKSLNSSQNITFEFLTEIVNTKLVDYGGRVVRCHGISQDPTTKNYLMVMDYMKEGNLRQYLQNKDNELSLYDKVCKLGSIAYGLKKIHQQNLVHQDFHSGNILNSDEESYITDLGLSRLVNQPKQTGKIFGVLPYVAPEVLRGEPYTQKADIYSFGIIAYELLANSYPYPEMDNTELALKVCQGYRPNIDKVPIPQLLKDLIKSCWDSNPNQRPNAEELREIIINWTNEIQNKRNTPFYQQYQEIEPKYNTFSQKPYQIHANAITTSKAINTNQITELLSKVKEINVMTENFDDLLINPIELKNNQAEQRQTETQIEIPPK